MSRLTLDPAEVEKLTRLEEDFLASWRATLTEHSQTPTAVAWSIEDAVAAYPGLGLRFETCDGECGRAVHGADPTLRLVLCDECRTEYDALTRDVMADIFRGGR
jgi:hypothetical protein